MGDQVLVLLPAETSELLAKWQGPYQVLWRAEKVDYLVDVHDKQKWKQVLHINMLQKRHNQVPISLLPTCSHWPPHNFSSVRSINVIDTICLLLVPCEHNFFNQCLLCLIVEVA